MLESIHLWEGLAVALEAELDWRQQGQMRLCYDDDTLRWAEEWVPTGREHGLDTRVLTASETCELLPHFNAAGLKGALYTSTDGCAEPEKVTPAFARAAARHGASISENCAVLAIEQQDGRVSGLQTEAGTVRADVVVCAGGAWTSRLLKPLGQKHPSLWIRGSAAHTQPVGIDMRKLVTWGKCACRQRPDGSYSFRTIKPVPYTGRTPHIHVKVLVDKRERPMPQFYLSDHSDNASDWLFQRIPEASRELVTMNFIATDHEPTALLDLVV
ncbi:MAG: FAD-dependent oxidoreductase [Gammaproteobacteria bacterium]|nr:FAD-dependent oxidoreductase [Gammaproteobacteria bacterium]